MSGGKGVREMVEYEVDGSDEVKLYDGTPGGTLGKPSGASVLHLKVCK